MIRLNNAQQNALFQLYQRSQDGHRSYLAFRRTVDPMTFEPTVAVVRWCGMWLCIEPCGYAHS